MNAIQFPLSRITVIFIIGILFAHFGKPDFIWMLVLLGISCIFFFFTFSFRKGQWLQGFAFGFAAYCLTFMIGVNCLMSQAVENDKNNYIHLISDSEKQYVTKLVIREKLKKTNAYQRYVALIKNIDGTACEGKVILNISHKSTINELSVGSQMLCNAPIVRHKPPLNPDQFDYGSYLSAKSIHGQIFVKNHSYSILGKKYIDIYYYADLIRSRIEMNLQNAGFHDDELQVLLALLLGQQQEISAEIIRNYQYAGAIHILSVSGLHVGFIVLFMNFIFRIFPNTKRGNFFKLTLTILFLWGFAVLAGLAPSVVRSAAMFSILTIGNHLKRATNSFHTLLVSLLIILLAIPSFLFDVGFQLSYMALFFILWLQPLLGKIWQPTHKVLTYLWDIVTVSCAAQIGTLPLSIYYFHQFPCAFMLTNIVVIPYLSVIMAVGLLLVPFALMNVIPSLLLSITEKLIWMLNTIIEKIASLDQLVLREIPLNAYLMVLLYLSIIALVWFFMKPKFNRFWSFLSTLVLLQSGFLYNKWAVAKCEEWIVYHQPRSSIITERSGKEVTVYANCSQDQYNKVIQPYLLANSLEVVKQMDVPKLSYAQQRKIAIIDSSGSFPAHTAPDVMLLRQSPRINLERILKSCKPKVVIADASNYRSLVHLWRTTCLKQKIPFHSTYEKGFFRLD